MSRNILYLGRSILLFLFLCITFKTYSQNNVGIGTNTPDKTALLELQANDKGILVPRMNTAQRTAIASPANGLMVYDTNLDCFFYYVASTSTWKSLCAGSGTPGPIGPTGPQGQAGLTGPLGPQGPIGTTGPQGLTGVAGPAGPQGITGSAGPQGLTGPAGNAGANGTNGTHCWDTNGNGINEASEDINQDGSWNGLDCGGNGTGTVGPTGATGPVGSAGAQGSTGVAGPSGATGAAGTAGATGANGYPCWDTNQNGSNDPSEDINFDNVWNTLDCSGTVGPTGPMGPTGPSGSSSGTDWQILGNSGTNGGSISTIGVNFIGTTDNQNLVFRTNNTYRGKFSTLGEFFVGTLNTILPGDLMNSVGNTTFPWAVNGYTDYAGGGVYGSITSGNSTYGSVQGEYRGSSNTGAGVRGIDVLDNAYGVHGVSSALIGYAGYFDGDVYSTSNYYTPSDEKLKVNIKQLSGSLEKLKMIRGIEYDMNVEKYPKYKLSKRHSFGVSAQEIQRIFPELVKQTKISTPNVSRNDTDKVVETMQITAVNYQGLIPILIEAIKEQSKSIDSLKTELKALQVKLK